MIRSAPCTTISAAGITWGVALVAHEGGGGQEVVSPGKRRSSRSPQDISTLGICHSFTPPSSDATIDREVLDSTRNGGSQVNQTTQLFTVRLYFDGKGVQWYEHMYIIGIGSRRVGTNVAASNDGLMWSSVKEMTKISHHYRHVTHSPTCNYV